MKRTLTLTLDALQEAGMRQDTLIIVTADYGGHDTTHGISQLEDMTIPWIVAGPGVHHIALSTNVNTTDTIATVAWALGLPLQPDWMAALRWKPLV